MGYRKSLAGIVLVTAAAMAPTAASAAVTHDAVSDMLTAYSQQRGLEAVRNLAQGMANHPGDEMTIAMAAVKSGIRIEHVKLAYTAAQIAATREEQQGASLDLPTLQAGPAVELVSNGSHLMGGSGTIGGTNVAALLMRELSAAKKNITVNMEDIKDAVNFLNMVAAAQAAAASGTTGPVTYKDALGNTQTVTVGADGTLTDASGASLPVSLNSDGSVNASSLSAALAGTISGLDPKNASVKKIQGLVDTLAAMDADAAVIVAGGPGTTTGADDGTDTQNQTGSSASDSPNAQYTVDTLSGG